MRVRVGGSQEERARLTGLLILLCARLAVAANSPELIVDSSHTSRLTRVQFSPDGASVLSGGRDGFVRVFGTATQRVEREWKAHNTAVLSMAIFGDNVVTGGEDFTLRVANYRTGVGRILSGHTGAIHAVTFSSDGSQVASAAADGTIRLWDVATGKETKLMRIGLADTIVNLANERSQSFRALLFLPNGKLMAGGTDRRVTVWDPAAGKIERSYTIGFADTVTALRLSPDGKWFVAGCADGSVRLHKLEGASTQFDIVNPRLPVHALSFSPDGRWLAIGLQSSNVERRSASDGRALRQFKGVGGDVHDVAFSPDGSLFATGGEGNTAALYQRIPVQSRLALLNRRARSFRLVEPEDEWLLPTSRLSDAVVFLELAWDRLADYRRITDRRGSPTVRAWHAVHSSGAEALAASPSLITLSTRDGKRDLSSRVPTTAGAFAPDAKVLAVGDSNGEVRLFDTANGTELAAWAAVSGPLTQLAYDPDGQRLAASSANAVSVWQVKDRKLLFRLDAASPDSLQFSPDGSRLLAEGRDGKRVIDAATGNVLISLSFLNEGRDWVTATPNGKFDASVGGMRNSGWRFANEPLNRYPIELFFNEYFYPGLLKSVLAGQTPPVTTSLDTIDRRQPKVTLTIEPDPEARDRASVKLTAVESEPDADRRTGSGVRDVRIFRNGVLVKLWPGEVVAPGGRSRALTATVSLLSGDNVFSAYAFNSSNIKSPDTQVTVSAPAKLRRDPVLHLLTIGISRYANSDFDLSFAVKDADAIGERLSRLSPLTRQFSAVRQIRLEDRHATRQNIITALQLLAGEKVPNPPPIFQGVTPAEPQDSILIYYAGHGTAWQNHFYLIPHDLGFTGRRTSLSPQALRPVLERSVSDRDLEASLLSLDVSRLALVIDACHSGQVLEAEERRRGPLNTRGLAQLAWEKGMYVLAASQSYQVALEAAALGHGFLSYSLIQALETLEADNHPPDNLISMEEWLDFGVARVPDLQRSLTDGKRNLVAAPGADSAPAESDMQTPRAYYRSDGGEVWIVRTITANPNP
ncbi:MAG: caspase family protein [Bryobacterales bacterium]|nr:caspase family protein [Bryobacterales bacterium]